MTTMNFLAHADAIIFDLRGNGGGRPEMVALIASYLFDKPTHLNDLYNRKEDTTSQYWTLPFVSGERMPTTPVFVLTSKDTFFGAEEFAYDLQNLKRAAILALLLGCGLRRSELTSLDVGQIQQRDHHWVIVDLVGKRRKNTNRTDSWMGESLC